MLGRMRSLFLMLAIFALAPAWAGQEGVLRGEFIFPPEKWHNHASCIVETPRGDLLVCWFHGSGERTADDVKILGSRKLKGEDRWSEPFVMADTPVYPDTNCAMVIDPQGRLWLFWPTILANRWESALMKYRVSTNYDGEGCPVWNVNEVMHVTPGLEFKTAVEDWLVKAEARCKDFDPSQWEEVGRGYLADLRRMANDKLSSRLGWMTRAHPLILGTGRMIVPLYSDGFSFSLMAITDDWGATWKASRPLCAFGNIQPSIVQRKDGSLYTLMRDNGPAPKRLHQSSSYDGGETWTEVTDSALLNPGSGAEVIRLQNGHWLLIGNDTEDERSQLAVQISDDEGVTWKWKRYLEKAESDPKSTRYHYPSVIQARDGALHASYSHHRDGRLKDGQGEEAKTIKHVQFDEGWVRKE